MILDNDYVRVVKQPVDRRRGQGPRHQLVETRGVQVGGDRQRAFLIGGVDDAEESLSGLLGDRDHADVIDHDQIAVTRSRR